MGQVDDQMDASSKAGSTGINRAKTGGSGMSDKPGSAAMSGSAGKKNFDRVLSSKAI
jgi:hypothetical protein